MVCSRVSHFVERNTNEKPPEIIATAKLELAPLLETAKTLVHALEHILLVLSTTDPAVQVVPGQGQ